MQQQPQVVMTFEFGKPTEVKVNGVKGPACLAFSRPFVEAIGGKVVHTEHTAEMAQQPVATVTETARTGLGSM